MLEKRHLESILAILVALTIEELLTLDPCPIICCDISHSMLQSRDALKTRNRGRIINNAREKIIKVISIKLYILQV